MTKEITKSIILQRLQDKFGLREFAPAKFLFDETVVPTYNVGRDLGETIADLRAVNITSAAAFTFFTVPANEKWFLNSYNVIFMGAGAIKVAGALVLRRDQPTHFCYLDLTKNQAISYAHLMPYPFPLEHGDRLQVLCDEYTSTQELRVYIDYMRETIR